MDGEMREVRERAYKDTAEIKLKEKGESGFDTQPCKWGKQWKRGLQNGEQAKTLIVPLIGALVMGPFQGAHN